MTTTRLRGRQGERLRSLALERDGWKCQRCGARGELQVHHLVPLAIGGSNVLENMETVCLPCHLTEHRVKRPRRMRVDPERIAWRRYLYRLAREDAAGGDSPTGGDV